MPHTFVLIHGAWHGGWCWRRVADRLHAQGHSVFTPTLSGLGEREHLRHDGIGLATHIEDVVNLIAFEELDDIVLCGHSYGGMVIAGVAEAARERIKSIVFLDAFVPRHGDSVLALTVPAVQGAIRDAMARGDAYIAPRPAAVFGVNEDDRPWVDRLCRPQPLAAFTEEIALTGAYEQIPRKTYIRAMRYDNEGFDRAYAGVRGDAAWQTHAAPCGHDVMVDQPDWLAEVLVKAA
jgi:pimeloyl-ACP methyl ester carboxylesterase